MFAMCPLRVRVAAVRLDILTTIKSVQTSHLPRLTILLVLLIQTSIDVDSCANIPNITVDIVGQSSNTGTICCIMLTRCIVVGNSLVHSVSVRTSLNAASGNT